MWDQTNKALTGTILLVDDDADFALLVRLTLEKFRPSNAFRSVSDGQEAISYLAGHGEYSDRARFPFPALMLLDLKMPRENGFGVLRWTRSEPTLYALPVVVISDSSFEQDTARAYEEGVSSVFQKPTSLDELQEQLKAITAYWLRSDQLHPPTDARRLPT